MVLALERHHLELVAMEFYWKEMFLSLLRKISSKLRQVDVGIPFMINRSSILPWINGKRWTTSCFIWLFFRLWRSIVDWSWRRQSWLSSSGQGCAKVFKGPTVYRHWTDKYAPYNCEEIAAVKGKHLTMSHPNSETSSEDTSCSKLLFVHSPVVYNSSCVRYYQLQPGKCPWVTQTCSSCRCISFHEWFRHQVHSQCTCEVPTS